MSQRPAFASSGCNREVVVRLVERLLAIGSATVLAWSHAPDVASLRTARLLSDVRAGLPTPHQFNPHG